MFTDIVIIVRGESGVRLQVQGTPSYCIGIKQGTHGAAEDDDQLDHCFCLSYSRLVGLIGTVAL